ncbi:hypothetical protein OG21DRAFT_1478103 [Imleria badia]|nr:hypothetical protein OG21DRAFT_1478103 [Imleria badia]
MTKVRASGEETHSTNNPPGPEPTGDSSASMTAYVSGSNSFAEFGWVPCSLCFQLLRFLSLFAEMVSTDGTVCGNLSPTFITGAAYSVAADGLYVQITGCIDASKFPFVDNDDSGQFDVRYPNGAQCTSGGYGASFIQRVEPAANRFRLCYCKSGDDQKNWNSHQDRAGCAVVVPGTYDFKDVSCS